MGNWGYPGFGTIAVLFWVFLIVIFVVIFAKALKGNNHYREESSKPLEIAKERYAKGEINKKEYEEMKKELK
jgi:putative membrane protein